MTINKLALFALAGACLVGGGVLAEDIDDNPIELPHDVVSAATAFQAYMKDAAQIGGFSDSSSVARSVRAGASYQPAQLEEGMIAYGAIAALQDEGFIEGVERAAGRGDAQQAFAERLIENPAAATQIDGAAGATKRIEAALGSRAQPLTDAGTAVKAAAYTVQHQAWSKEMVDDAQGRLAEVKRLSTAVFQPTESDNDAMVQALVDMNPQAAADDAPAGFTAIEARSLALAAEAVLGRAHGSDRASLSPLLTDTSSAMCLRMAKLNLYQCMAVAGPQYEDMFCLGQHAMMDTASCVNEATHGHARVQIASAAPIVGGGSGGGGYVRLASHHSFRVDPGE